MSVVLGGFFLLLILCVPMVLAWLFKGTYQKMNASSRHRQMESSMLRGLYDGKRTQEAAQNLRDKGYL